MKNSSRWIMWVDDSIWGVVDSQDDAIWFSEKILTNLKEYLSDEHPSWDMSIERVVSEPNALTTQLACVKAGYVYNTTWVQHTVRAERFFKLHRDPSDEVRAGGGRRRNRRRQRRRH